MKVVSVEFRSIEHPSNMSSSTIRVEN